MRAFASSASSIFLRDFTRALMASSYSSKKSGSSSLSWRLLRAIFIYFGVLVFKRRGCPKRESALVTRFVSLSFGVVLFARGLLSVVMLFVRGLLLVVMLLFARGLLTGVPPFGVTALNCPMRFDALTLLAFVIPCPFRILLRSVLNLLISLSSQNFLNLTIGFNRVVA